MRHIIYLLREILAFKILNLALSIAPPELRLYIARGLAAELHEFAKALKKEKQA